MIWTNKITWDCTELTESNLQLRLHDLAQYVQHRALKASCVYIWDENYYLIKMPQTGKQRLKRQ